MRQIWDKFETKNGEKYETIYFPQGESIFSDTIKLKENTSLIGMNPVSTQLILKENSEKFKNCVDNYLDAGYKISASSCNSKTWKAILVREDNEQESK